MNPMSQYPPRPEADEAMRREAALVIEKRLSADYEGLADDLCQLDGFYEDGYELCKALEDEFHYEGTLDLANELDNFDSEVRKLLKVKEREWEKQNNVQPPYPVGTRLVEGEITGIYEHDAARYLVDEGKGATRRLIVKFESARLPKPA